MVIDLGSGSLFKPTGLEQETGLLKDRWAQDGSGLKNFYYGGNTDTTIYTVPAGKRLYIIGITVSAPGANDSTGTLYDGGSGGTAKFNFYVATHNDRSYQFTTPLYFDIDIYIDRGGSTYAVPVMLTGWEENHT